MDSVNECVIEWLKGEKTATVTMPSNTRMKSKIVKLAEKDSAVTYIENKDGSILAHVPVEYVSIRQKRTLSDEQREEKTRILENARKGRK